MTILNLTGSDATTMCVLTQRLAEVYTGTGWRSSMSHSEARRYLQDDPQTVRMRVGDRVLLEEILKITIPVGSVLADVIDSTDLTTLSKEQFLAITTFKEAMK